MAEQGIYVDHVGMTYRGISGNVEALRDIDLHIEPGEFVSFVGPSGCGKTTLLNIIAGFILPTSGEVRVNGKPIHGPGPDRGVVFQQYAVFPWLTVQENVEFGLTLNANHMPEKKRREVAERFLHLVGLTQFRDSYPKELSGGMKQRVAIARAYTVNPQVLLMDEPFGALDAVTRNSMQEGLHRILEQERKTVVFITHSVEEATFLSSRVVVMATAPGRVREVIPVELPFPRPPEIKMDDRFIELRTHIEEQVQEEFRKTERAPQSGAAAQ